MWTFGAKVAGQIVAFGPDPHNPGKSIDYGSQVEQGTVLATLDPTPYKARVDQEMAAYDRAKAQLTLAQAKAKGEAAEVAKATVAAAEAGVRQSRVALDQAKTDLAYTVIKSPCKGVIIVIRVNVGQNVGPNPNAASVFLIAKNLKKMQVWAQVNEADMGRIKEGMDTTFTVDAFPKEVFKGKVKQIRLDAQMTQNVVIYTVVIDVDNRDPKLLPYLTANVMFEIDRRHNVLRVPNAALRWRPQPGQRQMVPHLSPPGKRRMTFVGACSGSRSPTAGT